MKRIISAKERRKLVPYSDQHIYRLEQQGLFPRRVKIGQHRVGWVEAEVLDWIEARMAEREAG